MDITLLPRFKARGHRGSWFATVNGESLPCLHKYWLHWPVYDDPGIRAGERQSDQLVAALHSLGRAVLTEDEPKLKDGKVIGFKRTGYVAIFKVSDIELGQSALRLRFGDRLANLV